jgi:hypothetical protein
MRYLGVLLLAFLLGCRAHGDGKEENELREKFMRQEMKDRGGLGAWEISQQPGVRLGPEWAALEPGLEGGRFVFGHRWMGQFGSLRLSAEGTEDMVLHLRGVVPLKTLRGPSAFHVRSAGIHLDTFYAKPDDEKIERDIFLTRATIDRFRTGPYLYLDIEATSPRAGDRGYLGYGFALQGISWKPVSAPPEPP